MTNAKGGRRRRRGRIRRQAAEEAKTGRNEAWWRVELGLDVWDLGETLSAKLDPSASPPSDPAALARAIRPQVVALVAKAKGAPPEVRRDPRRVGYVTDAIEAGQSSTFDGIWGLTTQVDLLQRIDKAHVPSVPPLPPPFSR